MQQLNNIGALLGRVLLALIFALSGLTKLTHLAGTAAYMQHAGMPLAMPLALAAGLLEFSGGILIMVGLRTRTVAFILFLFLIPVTVIFHAMQGGQMNQVHVMKNLAIMGGLLVVASLGAGRLSIDGTRAAASA